MRSTEAQNRAKTRYNQKHYDQVKISVPMGVRDLIQELAESAGLSMAQYIQHCIIADARAAGAHDIADTIAGGGQNVSDTYALFLR